MGADAVGNEADARRSSTAMVPSCCTSRIEAGGLGLLDHAVDDPLRRRRPAGRRRGGPAATSSSRCAQAVGRARGHHARGHHRRLPRPVLRRRDRAVRSTCRSRRNRPLNWNVLTVDSREPERVPRQLAAVDRARASSAAGSSRSPCRCSCPMNMSFLNYCALFMLPGWGDVLGLPVPERIARLQDPNVRPGDARAGRQSHEAGVFRRLADFGRLRPRRHVLRRRTRG